MSGGFSPFAISGKYQMSGGSRRLLTEPKKPSDKVASGHDFSERFLSLRTNGIAVAPTAVGRPRLPDNVAGTPTLKLRGGIKPS
jgi:hypothetical protein